MTLVQGIGVVEHARVVAAAMGRPAFITVADSAQAPGIPFVVKDNIDVEGLPTTAACPALDSPAPVSASVVTRLESAGYVPIAKANMDQFATGLVGTRSPYGACMSVPAPDRISGGSSSGSAVAVASGVVSLALGTDTAGSGRVPAAFNGLVGFKPTRGLLPVRGVFPACRSLDCVTTFTHTVAEARTAFAAMAGFDALDPWSRAAPAALPPAVAAHFGTIAIPDGPLDLDPAYAEAFAVSVQRARNLGLRVVPVDVSAFLAAAQLLYHGPWVAERYAAFGHLLEPDAPYLDPSVRAIALRGREMTAAGAFEAFEELARLKRQTESAWASVDALLLPTTPTHPTPAEVAADPIGVNARLGTFTNFVNLLDLCAVAVPGVDTADGRPFGVQLIAPAFADTPLLDLAATWMGEAPPAATPHPQPGTAAVALVGAHQSGLVLNGLVCGRGGRLLRRARTAAGYRMKRVPGSGVPRPGLVAGAGPPEGFAVEIWEVPLQTLGSLAAELTAPLRLGPLQLADGSFVLGYLGDDVALASAQDVSEFGAWRAVPG
jgi:allophanate hydrolase